MPADAGREADVRQPAGTVPEGRDAVSCEVEAPADRDRADHGDEPAGNRRDPALEDDRASRSRATETASVAPDVWSSSFSVSQNLITVPLTASMLTFGDGTPSIPPNCPIATWIPTPVRKPISTVREMKSARKPSRATRASNSRAPQ